MTIKGIKIITVDISQFMNKWNQVTYSKYYLLKKYNITANFGVDFSALLPKRNTARGLYYQIAPYEQSLLVSCSKGGAYLLVADLRKDSETYLEFNYFFLEDSSTTKKSIYIPRGCCYGFITVKDNTELVFKADNYCNSEFERCINLLDPYFSIKIPYPDKNSDNIELSTLLARGDLIMSVEDRCAPWVNESIVEYDET